MGARHKNRGQDDERDEQRRQQHNADPWTLHFTLEIARHHQQSANTRPLPRTATTSTGRVHSDMPTGCMLSKFPGRRVLTETLASRADDELLLRRAKICAAAARIDARSEKTRSSISDRVRHPPVSSHSTWLLPSYLPGAGLKRTRTDKGPSAGDHDRRLLCILRCVFVVQVRMAGGKKRGRSDGGAEDAEKKDAEEVDQPKRVRRAPSKPHESDAKDAKRAEPAKKGSRTGPGAAVAAVGAAKQRGRKSKKAGAEEGEDEEEGPDEEETDTKDATSDAEEEDEEEEDAEAADAAKSSEEEKRQEAAERAAAALAGAQRKALEDAESNSDDSDEESENESELSSDESEDDSSEDDDAEEDHDDEADDQPKKAKPLGGADAKTAVAPDSKGQASEALDSAAAAKTQSATATSDSDSDEEEESESEDDDDGDDEERKAAKALDGAVEPPPDNPTGGAGDASA